MFTKLKLALMISAPLVAGASAVALAQGQGHAKMVQKFDANGDGQLDDAERAQMKQAFEEKRAARKAEALAKFDANRDGQLDAGEKLAMRDARLTERFTKLDANGDGKISLDEFKAGADKGMHHGRHGHGRHRGAGVKP
jgi:hypothetical protein